MSMTMTGRRDLVLPRVGTPRNLDLPTRGGEVAEVAARMGQPLMPWQRHVVDVALEYDPDNEDRLCYDESDGTTMRQVGKTIGLLFKVMTWRSTMVPHRLGRQRTTFTMQKRDNARRKLERDFAEVLRATDQFVEVRNQKARPGRSTKQWKIGLNNGSEHLLFGRGNYLQIDTPSKQAGHGDTLDLGVMDEIRFYPDDRVEQAMRPAMSTRRDAQLWAWSTAGDHESFYLWAKVLAGRNGVERNLSSRVCYFEWSIPDDADLHDPEVWWEFHPALGWTIELDFIMAELARAERSPDEAAMDTFRNEYANQWVRTPQLSSDSRVWIIPEPTWELRGLKPDERQQPIVGPFTIGVDVSPDGESAAIGVAGFHPADGRIRVRVLHLAPGTFWVEEELARVRDAWEPKAFAYDAGGPTLAIAGAVKRAAGTVPIVPVSGGKYSAACEAFRVAFTEGDGRAWHENQDWLNSALAGATKKMRGTGWLWDRQTALADISPLPALTCAMWALEMTDDAPEDKETNLW